MGKWRPFPHRARGQMPKGQMNKTEAAYAEHLKSRVERGGLEWFKFEPWKLRLAKNTYYTPDFGAMNTDGTIECHEVKGFWRDDARVKIKVAAAEFPFKFIAVTRQSKKNGGGWEYEEF